MQPQMGQMESAGVSNGETNMASKIRKIAISYFSITQQEKINTVYSQMATLNPFTKTEILEKIDASSITKKDIKIIENIPNEDVLPVISKNQPTYYIIAGAFIEPTNATNMLNKLTKWEYNSEIIKTDNLLRVSYDSFNNKSEAIVALNKIRKENPEAWVLTK